MAQSFCSAPIAGLVYAGPATREEFDRIPLPETIHDWQPAAVYSSLQGDGLNYERQCHSKALGDHSKGSCTVIFQWFEYRVSEHLAAAPDKQAAA